MSERDSSGMQRMKIRARRTAHARGGDDVALSVFCPERGASTRPSACIKCSRCHGWRLGPNTGGGALFCEMIDSEGEGMELEELDPDSGWRGGDDMPRVMDVMTPDVFCVSADFDLKQVREIMLSDGIGCVPVVDKDGVPTGVLSRADLLREKGGAKGTVGQLATLRPFVVLESSFAPRAAALMAYQLVHHLVVISQEGHVVGMLSSLDIVRWVAEREGFIVPPRPRK